MAGWLEGLDFLFGNMLNPGAERVDGAGNPMQGMTPQIPGAEGQVPAVPQINPLQDLLKGMMGGQQSPMGGGMGMPGTGGGMPATNPAALGVKPDASNPLGDESIRKQMLMQYLAKMGKSPQSQQPMNPAMGGLGGGMGGGMGMSRGGGMGMPQQPGQLMSMPAPMMQRPKFIGSGGGGY